MYLGERKIKSTKSSGDYIIVTFEDGTTLKTSLEYIEFLKTKKPDGDIYHREQIFMANELYNTLKKHNCIAQRVPQILDRLSFSISENTKKKWEELAGVEFDERTMNDI